MILATGYFPTPAIQNFYFSMNKTHCSQSLGRANHSLGLLSQMNKFSAQTLLSLRKGRERERERSNSRAVCDHVFIQMWRKPLSSKRGWGSYVEKWERGWESCSIECAVPIGFYDIVDLVNASFSSELCERYCTGIRKRVPDLQWALLGLGHSGGQKTSCWFLALTLTQKVFKDFFPSLRLYFFFN